MTSHFKENMLFQTFIELDTQISNLTQRITSNRFIEVGDDPNFVRDIENILLRIYNKVRLIAPYFDLKTTSLSKANIYFALVMHINDTIRFLQEVKKRDYGSRQHTHDLLEKLEKCSKNIYAIGELMMAKSEVVH